MKCSYLIAIGSLMMFAGVSTGQGPIRSDYYPLEKGHKWTYRVIDPAKGDSKKQVVIEVVDTVKYTQKITKDGAVTEANFAGFVLQSTSGDKISRTHVFVSADGVHRFHDAGAAIDPPFLFFKFGLKKLGDTWECNSTSGDKTIKGTCTLNQEDVAVPYKKGEKLKAITVSFKADDGRVEVDYWFVKEIGMVKQRVKGKNLDIVLELEKFAK
jgi:hypothetical protein